VKYTNLIIEVTHRCNHDCLHCYAPWKRDTSMPDGELGTEDTLTLVDSLIDQVEPRVLTLTGGEPLLRGDLGDIVERVRERGVAVNLISNGSLLSEDNLGRIRPGDVSTWELPLLSADRTVHDRMSAAEGAFDKVVEAIADLKLRGERVVCVFVATRLNLDGLHRTLELAFALGADGVMFNRFNPGGRGYENLALLQASPAEIQAGLDVAEEFATSFGLPISCSIPLPPCLVDTSRYAHLSFGYCALGSDRAYFTVDPVGYLRPCNHSATVLGDLHASSFAELVESESMTCYREALPDMCVGCETAVDCQGGCKAAAEVCLGSPSCADPFVSAWAEFRRAPRAPA